MVPCLDDVEFVPLGEDTSTVFIVFILLVWLLIVTNTSSSVAVRRAADCHRSHSAPKQTMKTISSPVVPFFD